MLAQNHHPVLIVTTCAGDRRAGCLVGFATQVSIEPARLMVCLSDVNATTRVARDAGMLAVHTLPQDRTDLARLFGEETADEGAHKFDLCDWSPGPQGVPIVAGALEVVTGTIAERIPLGDHTAHVLTGLVDAHPGPSGATPLMLADVPGLHAGHPV